MTESAMCRAEDTLGSSKSDEARIDSLARTHRVCDLAAPHDAGEAPRRSGPVGGYAIIVGGTSSTRRYCGRQDLQDRLAMAGME